MEERQKVGRKKLHSLYWSLCWIDSISSHYYKSEVDVKQILKSWDKKENTTNVSYFTRKAITNAISVPWKQKSPNDYGYDERKLKRNCYMLTKQHWTVWLNYHLKHSLQVHMKRYQKEESARKLTDVVLVFSAMFIFYAWNGGKLLCLMYILCNFE